MLISLVVVSTQGMGGWGAPVFGQGSLTAAEGSVRVTRGKEGERETPLQVSAVGQTALVDKGLQGADGVFCTQAPS